ncbi:MAG: c-type cytochrome [Bacteroidota bacterium]
MYRLALSFFLLTTITLVNLGFKGKGNVLPKDEVDLENLPVELVLTNLGAPKYKHSVAKLDMEKAEIGRQIIFSGRARGKEHKGKRFSPYFRCTDCHNLVKETDSPTDLNPADRLAHAERNKLAFLPAYSLWGVYNRTAFYGGDYGKVYGDKIKNAKDSIGNAIQVCTQYAASGRLLKDWEIEGLLHYFKQHELRIKDLPSLTAADKKNVLYWQKLDQKEKQALRAKIESAFLQSYPATFVPALALDERKYGEGGNAANGALIYRKSCLHCHAGKRVSNYSLDNSSLTAKMFVKNLEEFNYASLYQIIRWGTFTKKRRKQTMPLYTKEQMSDQQIEDLVAYMKQLSEK